MKITNYNAIANVSNITVIGGVGYLKKTEKKVSAPRAGMTLTKEMEDRKVTIYYPDSCFTKAGNMRKDVSKRPLPHLDVWEAMRQWRAKRIETSVL